MDLNEMNENWQEEAPTLAAMEKVNPFKVPDGYFEEMSAQLLSRIKIIEKDNNQPLLEIPEGYFETLEDKIVSRSRLDELKENSTSEIFAVPDKYFETLESKIKARIDTNDKISSTPKVRRLTTSWITYAAAACLTLVVGISIYLNADSKNAETQIANLPAEEIVDYLQLYSDAGDAAIISESLDTETELSELSQEIPAQEIEQYLKLNL